MVDSNEWAEKAYELLAKVKEKSDDDYEKNITYISGGTLVLSLTFIEKIVDLNKSTWVDCLIAGWFLLAATLIINLVSHQLSSLDHSKAMEQLRTNDAKINSSVPFAMGE